jgi:uncharacterized membrane protein YdjX (TVP38/TMEM64 family)
MHRFLDNPVTKRILGLCSVVALASVTAWLLLGTDLGAHLREQDSIRRWIQDWPMLSPLLFIMAYAAAGILALPVWWMQVIAGYCFGLKTGIAWCLVGDAIAAGACLQFSRWAMRDWVQRRVQGHYRKIKELDEKLGHNGLLVVMATRLSLVIPFGISNYLFGVTRIRLMDVMAGTLLGGMLTKMIHVAVGVDPRMLASPRYLMVLVGVNVLLASPLLLRYLRPRWFGRA